MRVLLLLSESWNDTAHPNNNMTNWFSGFEGVEFYTLSCGPQSPSNRCCKNYFVLNDLAMARSFLPGRKAGKVLAYEDFPQSEDKSGSNIENSVYGRRDKLHKPIIRLARDVIWRYGRINKKELKRFLDDAKPDIIFSQRMGSVKMCRLENAVLKLTDAPLIAYTGDNEYAQGDSKGGFIAKLHTLWTRKWLNKMIPKYRLYYSMSREQMEFYTNKFGVKMKYLVKCGEFSKDRVHTKVNSPIKLVYAGKLYCGRDNTLAMIADVINKINKPETKLFLDIYTNDTVTQKHRQTLDIEGVSRLNGGVPADVLPAIFAKTDIVLHVEGLDEENAGTTRYSFSTKIMDCLSSGCAVLAVCNKNQAGYFYLESNDIAFTASDKDSLEKLLRGIADEPERITEYCKKAYEFGKQHHERKVVQKGLLADFEEIINESN